MAINKKAGKTEKLDGLSPDIQQEKIDALKKLAPEIFSDGKIDAEKLKRVVGENNVAEDERYRLEWAGKSEVFDEIAKRSACTLTLDEKRSSKDWEKSNNIFIEGENLEVLRMLQKAYHGKVKMIYIDPPYNTGKDFVYNDNFRVTEEEYCDDACNVDENGNIKKALKLNSRDSGRFHSNWLSMIYPRLYMARNLLRDDGVIFVSIDDNEIHNLRMVLNEVFGEENLMGQLVWHARGRSKTAVSIDHEYVLLYAKNKSLISPSFKPVSGITPNWYGELIERSYSNPDKDKRGDWRDAQHTVTKKKAHYTQSVNRNTGEVIVGKVVNDSDWYGHDTWMYPPNTVTNLFKDNRLYFIEKEDGTLALKVKKFKTEELPVSALRGLIERSEISSRHGSEEFDSLIGADVFDYPKPTSLIRRFISASTKNDDICLDFFAGSGTTAHAVMKQNALDGANRKYICAQMPEETLEGSESRKAGYKKISDIAIDRIKKSAEKVKKEHPEFMGDLGVRVYKETDSNFPQWHARAFESDEALKQAMIDYGKASVAGSTYDRATEVLLKLGYPLTTPLEEKKGYFTTPDGIALVLDSAMTMDGLKKVLSESLKTIVVLEKLFKKDEDKINFGLRCKETGVIFQTI